MCMPDFGDDLPSGLKNGCGQFSLFKQLYYQDNKSRPEELQSQQRLLVFNAGPFRSCGYRRRTDLEVRIYQRHLVAVVSYLLFVYKEIVHHYITDMISFRLFQ